MDEKSWVQNRTDKAMNKMRITADTILAILQGIFTKADYTIDDDLSPYCGKTIMDVLNIEFYTFKQRLHSAEDYIASINTSLNQSYCLCSLENIERKYSKDIDNVTVYGKLTFWLQSSKIKLLESFIEECDRLLCGERINFTVDKEKRRAAVFFGNVISVSSDVHSEIGESQICEVGFTMVVSPDIIGYDDYTVELTTGSEEYERLPVVSLNIAANMTNKAVPRINAAGSTGMINLSKVRVFNLVFYGFNGKTVNKLSEVLLGKAGNNQPSESDNNETFYLRLTRNGTQHDYETVISDISSQLENDTGYEVFSLSLAERGKVNETNS